MQTDPPLVAIATPVYNGEKYVAETLASVQAQTYPNLVHVVVDNACTDRSPEIIESFKGGRVPVHVSRNPETVPVNRNWSVTAARVPADARYFCILCADDTLEPTAIQRMVEVAESDPAIELVGCMARRGDIVQPTDLPRDTTVFDGNRIARRFLNKESDAVPHNYGLYRRRPEDFESDFFDPDIVMMDTDACLRALSRGKLGYVHEPLVMLRVHPDQLFVQQTKASRHSVFEPLVLIDRWAHVLMGPREAKRCRTRHLRVIYRFLLFWLATGQKSFVEHHMKRLDELGARPSLLDYEKAVLEWPLREVVKRYRRRKSLVSTQARGFGDAGFPVDDALPSFMNLGVWKR
ncbi:MAG: glycosyltransferase [Myxococcales bacterium]|nr:glycosyltransferase [Myxococcales bacterium]